MKINRCQHQAITAKRKTAGRVRGMPLSQYRDGFSLVELIVSGVLMGAVLMMAVPSLKWIAWERRAAVQRQEALIAVANIMEQITVQRWDQITNERAEGITLAEQTRRQIPDAELNVTVGTHPKNPEAKRIAITLSWPDRSGTRVSPVRLTSWVYRRGRYE